jgi:hypothetical protein
MCAFVDDVGTGFRRSGDTAIHVPVFDMVV